MGPGVDANVIDLRSEVCPTDWDLRIGPTRHAYFNIRLADGLRVVDGGIVVDSEGRRGGDAISGQQADWVDASGTAVPGHRVGIAVFLYPSVGSPPWNVADYGTITVNPLGDAPRNLSKGDTMDLAIRLIVHDGDAGEAGVAAMFESFKQERLV